MGSDFPALDSGSTMSLQTLISYNDIHSIFFEENSIRAFIVIIIKSC